MRIGVAACGYADGYPRSAPGGNDAGTPVLVDGVAHAHRRPRLDGHDHRRSRRRCRRATIGSEVVLWGRAGSGAVLSIDDVAAAAGTVGYELMCARAPRVPVAVVP